MYGIGALVFKFYLTTENMNLTLQETDLCVGGVNRRLFVDIIRILLKEYLITYLT